MNVTQCYWWWVNIGSGNGLVPSGNKPLSELRVTCRHMAPLGPNELNFCQLFTLDSPYLTLMCEVRGSVLCATSIVVMLYALMHHIGPLNSLTPRRYSWNLELVFFKITSMVDMLSISGILPSGECHKTVLMINQPLVQVMACCHLETRHYCNQYRPSAVIP